MLPVFTAEEMAELDKRTIQGLGIPGMVLMESAARGVFRTALEILYDTYGLSIPQIHPINDDECEYDTEDHCYCNFPARAIAQGREVVVFCGKGNNGGDGLAAARMLDSAGADVEIILLARGEELTGDARANYEMVKTLGLPMIENATNEDLIIGEGCHLVIDALLGTGIEGPSRGVIAEAIEEINDAACPALSIDIPSGVEGSTGRAEGPAVAASATATMAALKRGLILSPGRELAGAVSIVDIGTPKRLIAEYKPYLWLLEPDDVLEMLPARPEDTHKGECGRVFIIGGSKGLTGAACMASEACVKSGAGLVMLGIPESLNAVAEIKLTEAMSIPLPETVTGSLSSEAEEEIWKRLEWATAAVLGPGISRNEETLKLARKIIAEINLPLVIDADALYALSGQSDMLLNLPPHAILTPHIGEFARLANVTPDEVRMNRIDLVRKKAQAWNTVILLKGSPTLVAAPDGKVYINPTGNSGMATGGVGDVLSGVIGALLGQGVEPIDAAAAGAYIHGMAGDLALEECGIFALSATDIIAKLGAAFGAFGC